MKKNEFEHLVTEAVTELPGFFKKKLENVDIIIERKPDMGTARKIGLRSHEHLMGLYQGVPLKSRTHYYGMVMPDKITLYQDNIEHHCERTGMEIYEKVRQVIQHEISHHFGISDKRLRDLGIY